MNEFTPLPQNPLPPTTPKKELSEELEIVEIEPTNEEKLQRAKNDIETTNEQLSWLSKQKKRLETECQLSTERLNEIQNQISENEQKLLTQTKQNQVVSKKVMALEMLGVAKKTNLLLLIMVVPFFLLLAFAPITNTLVVVSILAFLGSFGYQFVTNQRKINYLKKEYHL